MTTAATRLRELIRRTEASVVPLALDGISAKLAEAAGFEALYLGGGSLGYQKTCAEAHLSLTQMAHAAMEIGAASRLPLIIDGQCGWGDPMHLRHTIATVEAAGAAGIEIEDQITPKRVHHHVGVEHLVPTELMVEKIKVAGAARRDPDFVIIARTNAAARDSVDGALRRIEAYRRAGADMLLVVLRNPDHARIVAERVEGPHVYITTRGISELSLSDLGTLGYKLVIDPMTPFYACHKALRLCYEAMAKGLADPTVGVDMTAEMELIHEAIDLEAMLEIERRTVETSHS